MSEVWDATYQAVRSKIHNGDIGSAVEQVFHSVGLSTVLSNIYNLANETFAEYQRPSIMLKPTISNDGNKYCALYGDNLVDGVAGFGESIHEAFLDFDKNFYAKDLK